MRYSEHVKMPKQLVKRIRVNLPVIKKQSFKWIRRKAATTKKQSFQWQILFVKLKASTLRTYGNVLVGWLLFI